MFTNKYVLFYFRKFFKFEQKIQIFFFFSMYLKYVESKDYLKSKDFYLN